MIDVTHIPYNYSLMTLKMCVCVYSEYDYVLPWYQMSTHKEDGVQCLKLFFFNEYLTHTYIHINEKKKKIIAFEY